MSVKLLKYNEFKKNSKEEDVAADTFKAKEMDGLTTVGPLEGDDDAEKEFKDNKEVDNLPE